MPGGYKTTGEGAGIASNSFRPRASLFPTKRPFKKAKKAKPTVATLTKELAQVKRKLNGAVELKYNDHNGLGGENIDSSGTVVALSLLAEGDQIGQRTGQTVRSREIDIKGVFTNYIGVGTSVAMIRWIVVIDTMCNGSLPAVLDILHTADVRSPLNEVTTRNRFRVLCDKLVLLEPAGTHPTDQIFSCKKALDHNIEFKGTTVNITDAGKNNLFLMMISDHVLASAPIAWYYTRHHWIDM